MRNHRISLVIAIAALTFAGPAVAAGKRAPGKPIFDGKTLSGWEGDPRFWRVEDGAITGQTTAENPTKGNTFLIWRDGSTVDDFELSLQYRIVGGNSGVQYRSAETGPFVVSGYQADIDAGDTFSGALYDENGRGLLAKRGERTRVGDDHKPAVTGKVGDAARLQAAIKKEGWNDYLVVARGNHLVHSINGKVTADVTDDDASARKASGILALQIHAGAPMMVQFRNIVLARTRLARGKKVVFVAGGKSHGYGGHDHRAGCRLLADHLEASGLGIVTSVYYPGWPADPTAFDNADALVVYADGGPGHPIAQHLDEIAPLARKGLGVGMIHYAVEVEKGKAGDAFLDWIGGYFEAYWSVNPHWTPVDVKIGQHPITRGVRPYSVPDEWYFQMRFRPDGKLVPLLTAVPPASTMSRPDGAHEGNPAVRAAVARSEPQHMVWARQRPDGGRGFGFTGGHVHWNWAQPDHRRLALNAIAWIAGVDIPAGGVPTRAVTLEDLEKNADEPVPASFDRAKIAALVGKLAEAK